MDLSKDMEWYNVKDGALIQGKGVNKKNYNRKINEKARGRGILAAQKETFLVTGQDFQITKETKWIDRCRIPLRSHKFMVFWSGVFQVKRKTGQK